MPTLTHVPEWLTRMVEDARRIDLTVHDRIIDLREAVTLPKPRQHEQAARIEIPAACIELVTSWKP